MDEFTNEEKHRIDVLYGEDFKSEDFTPDDVKLIQRWESVKAKHDEKVQAQIEIMKQESEQKLSESNELFELAKKNVKELAKRSRKRYKELRQNG